MDVSASQLQPLESEHRPIVELLRLAGPTVAQMASYTVMQFLDIWMLSRVGDRIAPPTAAANSGILAFSFISLGMGVLWVVNTLVSQAFGRRDYPGCGQYLWQGVWFGLIFGTLSMPALPFVHGGFAALGHEPRLVDLEASYLRIVVSFAAVKLVGTAVAQFLLAIDHATTVMVSTIAGVCVNALAAWVLIFGRLGVPQYDVVGAAWAQNIGVAVETLVLIGFALTPFVRRTFHVFDARLRWPLMRTLLRVGLPSGLQVTAEVLAWGAWGNVVMARFGIDAMAGTNFVFRYMSVSFMPAFGIGTAVTALVGRYIGRKQPDIAVQRAHLGFKVSAIYMLCCAALFIVFRRPLMHVFAADEDVVRIGAMALVFAGVYQLFDAMYIVYYGGLRGAGDTLAPAVVTAGLCWSITVLGGYAVAYYAPQLGTAGPWIAATAYGVILGIFMLTRFINGGWRRINLDAYAAADKVPHLQFVAEP